MKVLLTGLIALTCLFAKSQSIYYISSSGNNGNSGVTTASPWKTIPYLQPGKTYLLNRGDTFYFHITDIANGDTAQKILISAYGTGTQPVISLYKKAKQTRWIQHGGNVWKIALTNADNFTGFQPVDANVGFIKVGGKVWGNKLSNLAQLSSAWDFYSDRDYLYVYFSGTPLSNAAIEFSCNYNAIIASDNMTVSDVAIRGAGAHAISVPNKKNVTLNNITIDEIGGSYLPGYGAGTTRYGSGIEFWNGGRNCIVEGCSVSNVYDVAFTMQGNGSGTAFNNVVFRNNKAFDNEQSFETWVSGGQPGFTNCRFVNNTCSTAGFGWSHSVRPDTTVAVHLLAYSWAVQNTDLVIENNYFSRAKCGLYYWGVWDAVPPFISRNNTIVLDASTTIRSQVNEFHVSNAADFVAATGKEKGSTFQVYQPQLRLGCKVFLQGAYNVSTGLMNNTLNAAGILNDNALQQPYSGGPAGYMGGETVAAGFYVQHPEIVDWILLELQNTSNASDFFRRAVFVRQDGQLVDTDGVSTMIAITGLSPANYYITLHHRNHLPLRSALAVQFVNGSGHYDFSDSSTRGYQNQGYAATTKMGDVWVMRGGNANSNFNIKYNGPQNDANQIQNVGLGGLIGLVVSRVYGASDINMDGLIKTNGPSNDQNFLLNTVLGGLLGGVYLAQL